VGLGALNALWALFLWGQLLVARAGGAAFCGFGESTSCGDLWDGPFASAIHSATKMPVAGWGLMWGVVATALPLLAWLRSSEGKETGALVSGTKLTAIAGLGAVVGLLVASASAGALCTLCVGTYILVGCYGAVALFGWRAHGFADVGPGAGAAVGATLAAYVLLVYPGSHTPQNAEKATANALETAAKAAKAGAGHAAGDGHDHGPGAHGGSATPGAGGPPDFAKGPGTGDAERDALLNEFIQTLPPEVRATLSSSIGMWHASQAAPAKPPRAVLGPATAPTKIVEWTDVLCGHCAQMHFTLEQIGQHAPPGSFSVEPRHFPLDNSCNPAVQRRGPEPISCVAAGIQICMEGDPKAHELTGELFKNQRSLTNVEAVYKVAEAFRPRAELKKCVESPETRQKLADDVAYALTLNPEGTPIVLINGKKGNGFGAFLYAMIMTNGTGTHPAFASLPKPDLNAHIH
jgi:serine/threonine-protein kinase